jgi:hypothetical protein
MPVNSPRLQTIFLLLLSSLCLLGAAMYNGYPLIYSDTSTYIESGFALDTPLDRPITYGLLLRMFSLNGVSLWFVAFAQSLILIIPLYLSVRHFSASSKPASLTFFIVLTLSMATGLSWVASLILPDIFTPVCLLCMILLIFAPLRLSWKILLYIILLLCTASHVSHVVINILFVAAISLFLFYRKRKKRALFTNKFQIPAILLISLAAFFTMGSAIGKSRHVFMMGHLLESGILDAYLDDNCGKENPKLCDVRSSLPNDAGSFLWNSHGDSALLKSGGWIESKKEYDRIIFGTLKNPRYLSMHVLASAKSSLKQFVSIGIGEGLCAYPEQGLVNKRITTYFPYEKREFEYSLQQQGELTHLPKVNFVNFIYTAISALLLAGWFLFYFRHSAFDGKLRIFICCLLLGYCINAFTCGTLATTSIRFSVRESWFFPLAVILILVSAWKAKQSGTGMFNK